MVIQRRGVNGLEVLDWGMVCVDCVRATVTGLAAGLATWLLRLVLLLLVATSLACAFRRSSPPAIQTHREGLGVYGVDPDIIVTATLRIDDGTTYGGFRDPSVSPPINRFHFRIQSPPTHLGWGGHLTVEAEGYVPLRDVRVVIGTGDHELPSLTMVRVPTRRFPPEAGRIEVCGVDLCDEGHRTWDWRGASMFTLPARFAAGEDLSPQIHWMQETGVNVARVFVNWDFLDAAEAGTTPIRPFDHPGYDALLGAFFDRMASAGLRVEATVVTENGRPASYWRPILQRVFDLAAARWNVFVEVMNEPWARDLDPGAVMLGVNRYPGVVLSAYGSMPSTGTELAADPIPVLDYVTPHFARDSHFPHNSKDALWVRAGLRVPVIVDEPMGIGPPRPRGGRTQDAAAVWSHFAICRLFAAGCTIHTQAGVSGLTPMQANDPVTQQIVEGIAALWSFLPGRTYTGSYTRAGLTTFGLVYRDGDSLVNHAYGSTGR